MTSIRTVRSIIGFELRIRVVLILLSAYCAVRLLKLDFLVSVVLDEDMTLVFSVSSRWRSGVADDEGRALPGVYLLRGRWRPKAKYCVASFGRWLFIDSGPIFYGLALICACQL